MWLAQRKFGGFKSIVFRSCDGTKKGAHRICLALKNLKVDIELKITAKIDKNLVGKVSNSWSQGKYYRDAAWLMFTNRKVGAYKHPQLTVNLFEDEVWIGFRSHGDDEYAFRYPFKIGDYARKHPKRFRKLVSSLSKVEWGFDSDERTNNFTTPRRFTSRELEIRLRQKFEWINTRFDKRDPLAKNSRIADEIVDIFSRLYPLYAITVGKSFQIERLLPEKQLETVEIVDLSRSRKEVLEKAKKVFKKGGKGIDLSGIYAPSRKIRVPIRESRKIVIRYYAALLDKLNLRPVEIGGETLLVAPGMRIPPVRKIKRFKAFLRKIIRIMGGNPETVKIMVKEPTSDARIIDKQIVFNATLINHSPIFWMIIAARELASLRYKEHYQHVKAMSILLERAIKHLDEIDTRFS